MKLSIVLEADSLQGLAKEVEALDKALKGASPAEVAADAPSKSEPVAGAATGPGRKKRAAAKPAEETGGEEIENESTEDAGTDDEDLMGLSDDEPKVTQKEVISAFQAYAKAKGVEKAKAVIKKFGAKSVREIKEADFEKAMKAVQL